MDIVTSANKESALLSSLEKTVKSNPYQYRYQSNFPNSSLSCVAVSPQVAPAGNPVGNQLTFRIPSYGLLTDMVIKSTLTTGGDNSAVDNTNLGERVFSRVSLNSHGKSICQNTSDYLHVRGKDSNVERALKHADVTNSTTSFDTTAISVHTPLYFSFFEKTSNYLPLDFTEELEVICDINSQAGMGLAAALTAGTFTLYCWYRSLDSDNNKEYIQKQFPSDKPFVSLIYDTFTETVPMANGSTSTNINLRSNSAIFATHVFCKNATDRGADKAITDLTFSVSGRNIMNAIPADILRFREKNYGTAGMKMGDDGALTYASNELRPLSIYWGDVKDRSFNSGSVSLGNTNNPSITISHADPGDATHSLIVVHEFWRLLTINPSNGVLDIGLSV